MGNSQYSDRSLNAVSALGESTAKRYLASSASSRESLELTNLLRILGRSGDHVGKDEMVIIWVPTKGRLQKGRVDG